MRDALAVSLCILLAGLLWNQAWHTERREVMLRTRQFFGNRIAVQKKSSYWQRYLQQLQTQLNRIGVNVSVAQYARYVPVGMVLFISITHFVFGVPMWIGLTMSVLLLLLPRQIVAELSARYVIQVRKRLILDVINPGIHALTNGTLEDACAEIEREAKSPMIRREFQYINELGKAPGDMNVAKAMWIRARELGIAEFETLAIATLEGERYNAKLTEVWRDIRQALSDKVQAQNSLLSALSTYRMAAMVLFVASLLFIVFGYERLHIHGVMQVGVVMTLVSYFIGVSQVAKTNHVE